LEAGTGVERKMRYRILGPLEVEAEEGTVPLGPPKQRDLLGLLLLSPRQAVSISSMIEHLWGDAAPRSAEHAIQTYVSGLRSRLGAGVIATTTRGYRIDIDDGDVDAAVFDQLAASAATALAQGDAALAFDLSVRLLPSGRDRRWPTWDWLAAHIPEPCASSKSICRPSSAGQRRQSKWDMPPTCSPSWNR
jgi:DNA-binding SARP family transcriptional activator